MTNALREGVDFLDYLSHRLKAGEVDESVVVALLQGFTDAADGNSAGCDITAQDM